MDDLSGLDWSSPPSSQNKSAGTSFPALRPSPTPSLPSLSGRSTPLSSQPSGPILNRKIGSKPTAAASDSFSSLLSIGANKSKPSGAGLSLQERQKQLQDEKLRQEAERAKKSGLGGDAAAWESLGSGSGKSTPDPASIRPKPPNGTFGSLRAPEASFAAYSARKIPVEETEDDILAAFDSSAPVDASTHFPIPVSTKNGLNAPGSGLTSRSNNLDLADDDDDPFGLNQIPKSRSQPLSQPVASTVDDDFDILGDLAKPVSELPKPSVAKTLPVQDEDSSSDDDVPTDPRDKAVAELVDMGFPASKAAEALEHTTSGHDVQAAVGWLLNQAHNESKAKTEQSRPPFEDRDNARRSREPTPRGRSQPQDPPLPAWSRSSSRRQDAESPAREKDVSQYAQDLGTSLFKSANSLWKTGRKQVQKAVADLQQDSDSSQPKWMREAQAQHESEQARRTQTQKQPDLTTEAMMLEAGAGRPPPRQMSRSPRAEFASDMPPARRQTPQPASSRPPGRLTREDIEEQTSQAYVSPARRKKAATPSPEPSATRPTHTRPSNPSPIQAGGSLLGSAQTPSPVAPPPTRSTPKPSSTPLPTRPKAPTRNVPSLPPSTLSTSTKQRKLGTEAFKRGDYGSAHELYTRALAPLPSNHPISIVILTNRALTGLKNGDPKSCIADADAAITIIGISRGENETIALGPGEDKSMSEFWGKALTRKAEALEHMEKWAEAAKVWHEAVEAGVGGAIAIQGRNRSEKAAGGAARASSGAPVRNTTPAGRKPPAKPPARPAVSMQKSAEAVKALREAQKAAERVDDEKFALVDQVDAKLAAWKGTKSDNLRALLGSLDTVLWPEAGWKKVGMGELVMPNKVKIIYMKAIAKVHPDKVRVVFVL